jgi:hypothetical protein
MFGQLADDPAAGAAGVDVDGVVVVALPLELDGVVVVALEPDVPDVSLVWA